MSGIAAAYSIRQLGPSDGQWSRVDKHRDLTDGFYKSFSASASGLRASFVVTGSAASGGVALLAVPVPGSPQRLEIGSWESRVPFLTDVGPWDGPGETIYRAEAQIKAISLAGKVTADVSPIFLASRSALGTKVILALGTRAARPVAGTTYYVLVRVTSTEDTVRQVAWPALYCPG